MVSEDLKKRVHTAATRIEQSPEAGVVFIHVLDREGRGFMTVGASTTDRAAALKDLAKRLRLVADQIDGEVQ